MYDPQKRSHREPCLIAEEEIQFRVPVFSEGFTQQAWGVPILHMPIEGQLLTGS